jgi:ATP-dependent Lon protease
LIISNLPVIILRGAVLLPHCELRLELKEDVDKKTLKVAEELYDNNVLIVSPIDQLDINVDIKNLPKFATIAKINLNMEINSNITRVVIEGLRRVNINEYNTTNENKVLEASIRSTTKFAIAPKDEIALIRKIIKDLENYVSRVPYMSNSILAQVTQEKSISKVTDLVANYLPVALERKIEYLTTPNPYTRTIMILEDIRLEEEIVGLEEKIETKLKKNLDDSQKDYILREKIRIIKEELGDISVKDEEITELRDKIKDLKCDKKIKDKLYNELKKYEMMNNASPEMGMVRNYIDWLISLPWGVYSKEEVDLNKVRDTLDGTHYGLDKIKTRIIEFLAVKQLSNNLNSPIICLVGPPGVGKTSLAKSIANSIKRKFVKISVGGVNDEAEIIGHRRTYIGANPGRIISAIKKAKTSNPVFLIDEIDKMTKDYRGDPASALLEVLDKEQNKYFYDNYIEEEYDLSKVMFILTANYINQIPESLRDRLEIIELSGYTEYEKLDIAKKHLLPDEIKENGLNKINIEIKDDCIMEIIRHYTREAGVRELERNISTILRKIAKNTLENKKDKYIITTKNINEYLGKKKYFYSEKSEKEEVGVATGLAYTEFGGDILPIEITYFKGKGNLVLTGSLGDVMKESAQIALSYIKSHCKDFKIDYELIANSDVHIHVPEGAVRKDGPSAGITLTTALISAFTNKPVTKDIGMTGEMTLRGTILPIGGLKEKSLGAHRSGIKKIIIPKQNERDLDDIPKEIRDDLEFILVSEYIEVYNIIYKK